MNSIKRSLTRIKNRIINFLKQLEHKVDITNKTPRLLQRHKNTTLYYDINFLKIILLHLN